MWLRRSASGGAPSSDLGCAEATFCREGRREGARKGYPSVTAVPEAVTISMAPSLPTVS